VLVDDLTVSSDELIEQSRQVREDLELAMAACRAAREDESWPGCEVWVLAARAVVVSYTGGAPVGAGATS
jgi:hypothetical protein